MFYNPVTEFAVSGFMTLLLTDLSKHTVFIQLPSLISVTYY